LSFIRTNTYILGALILLSVLLGRRTPSLHPSPVSRPP
jgi:hypothetical protein